MRLSDRVSRLYAPVVHLTALATGLVWLAFGASAHDALVIAISVLIITCPCALALAVPTVQAMASGAFFRSGLFLNDAAGLEKLGEIDTVDFRQDRHTDPAGAARRQCATRSPPDLLELAGTAGALQPAIRWRWLWRVRPRAARAARRRARDAGAGRRRAVRRRRGAARLGGLLRRRDAPAGEAEASAHLRPPGRPLGAAADPPDAAARRGQGRRGSARKRPARLAILSGDRPEAVAPIARAAGRRRTGAAARNPPTKSPSSRN